MGKIVKKINLMLHPLKGQKTGNYGTNLFIYTQLGDLKHGFVVGVCIHVNAQQTNFLLTNNMGKWRHNESI